MAQVPDDFPRWLLRFLDKDIREAYNLSHTILGVKSYTSSTVRNQCSPEKSGIFEHADATAQVQYSALRYL